MDVAYSKSNQSKVPNRATEDHKLWLFDLAHGNLTDEQIVRGFIKYYALNGFCIGNMVDDIVFRTCYEASAAKGYLEAALRRAAGDENVHA